MYYKNIFKALAVLLCAVLFSSFVTPSASFAAADKNEVKKILRELLKENPELVMEILRSNSEEVLEIAQEGSELRKRKILLAQWSKDLLIPKKAALAERPSIGADNAPVTIVAFTDFTCMYCQQGEQTVRTLQKQYRNKVRIVYKSLPMKGNPGAMESAEFMQAAYKLDKTKSWVVFDDFFKNRSKIISPEGESYLRSTVINQGYNMQKFMAEAKSARVKKLLQEDADDAKKLDIQGTPCFLVNDIVIRGALQEDLFRLAIDVALAEVERTSGKKK